MSCHAGVITEAAAERSEASATACHLTELQMIVHAAGLVRTV